MQISGLIGNYKIKKNVPPFFQTFNQAHDSFDVSWMMDQMYGYSFMIRYRVADSNGQWIERGGISNYNTRLEGLQPLTTYEYQVKAQNQYGWSEWSVTGTGRTETGTLSS